MLLYNYSDTSQDVPRNLKDSWNVLFPFTSLRAVSFPRAKSLMLSQSVKACTPIRTSHVISKKLSKVADVKGPCSILSAKFPIKGAVYLTVSKTKDHDIGILTHNNCGLIAILASMICM